jgi:MFS family permease
MQTIGVTWLVLHLTHSGTQLGLVVAAQFLPILLFGAWGGIIADSFNKRRILYITQWASGILALILGVLVITNNVELWMVYTLALALGLVNVVDNPTRQSFVVEMVGEENLKNAIALNSTMVNAARVIGPSIAGVLIATAGVGKCFIFNAVSYLAVLVALKMMRKRELHPAKISPIGKGQIRAGLKYVWGNPTLKATLLMMFIVGTFAFEFPVIFPLFATITLHGNAGTYSAMMAASAAGAVMGGLYTAGHVSVRQMQLIIVSVLFGLSTVLAALLPNLITVNIVLVLVGALSIIFIALGNTTLQLNSEPSMRGRVMALWSMAFLGTTPIGGPIMGYLSDHSNPRIALATGGISAIVAGIVGYYIYKRSNPVNVTPLPAEA